MTFKALITEETDSGFVCSIKERQISELPEGEVLIKVHYSSLNYKDALSASGNKGVSRNFPHTPGIDASGIVEESQSASFKKGDEVGRFNLGSTVVVLLPNEAEIEWTPNVSFGTNVKVGEKIAQLSKIK